MTRSKLRWETDLLRRALALGPRYSVSYVCVSEHCTTPHFKRQQRIHSVNEVRERVLINEGQALRQENMEEHVTISLIQNCLQWGKEEGNVSKLCTSPQSHLLSNPFCVSKFRLQICSLNDASFLGFGCLCSHCFHMNFFSPSVPYLVSLHSPWFDFSFDNFQNSPQNISSVSIVHYHSVIFF